jgi:hypothetical protein
VLVSAVVGLVQYLFVVVVGKVMVEKEVVFLVEELLRLDCLSKKKNT